MQRLSADQYSALREGASVLEADGYGEKVLQLDNGTFLKIFRRKRLLSKNLVTPPARRFAHNAARLHQLGIPCPHVIGLYRMARPYRSLVHYHPLPGRTLRQLFGECPPDERTTVVAQLKAFIIRLHDLGIYFRSLHLGNIVLTPDNELGLIDISDMRCLSRPLSQRMRRRNYQHLRRYETDLALLGADLQATFRSASR